MEGNRGIERFLSAKSSILMHTIRRALELFRFTLKSSMQKFDSKAQVAEFHSPFQRADDVRKGKRRCFEEMN